MLALQKELHELEVRVLNQHINALTAQLQDARHALEVMRVRTTGLAPVAAEETGEGKENPLRQSNPVQWIMDSLEEVVPLGNENARQGVRSWVQRQIRLRGQGSIDEILEEAIQGDVTDEHEEEVEA